MSIEERLRLLEEGESVRRVLIRYCDAVDRFDARAAAREYAVNAVDRHTGIVVRGRQALVEFFGQGMARLECAAHVISNHQIDVSGDEATASAYVMAFLWDRKAYSEERGDQGLVEPFEVAPFVSRNIRRPADRVLIGRYDDRLRKISGHWKIVERAVNVSTVLGLKEEVLAEVTAESTLAD